MFSEVSTLLDNSTAVLEMRSDSDTVGTIGKVCESVVSDFFDMIVSIVNKILAEDLVVFMNMSETLNMLVGQDDVFKNVAVIFDIIGVGCIN